MIAALAIDTVGRHLEIPDDVTECIRLSVVEACLNAMEHGGGDFLFRLVVEDDVRIMVEIEDHGPGFDPNMERGDSATRVHGCVKRRGWGLKLISEMMDDLQIQSEPGRTMIRMWKNFPGVKERS